MLGIGQGRRTAPGTPVRPAQEPAEQDVAAAPVVGLRPAAAAGQPGAAGGWALDATMAVVRTGPGWGLRPWAGFGVFCAYAAVALVIGFATIPRRDA